MREADLFEPVKSFLLDKVGCDKVYGEVLDCDVLGVSGTVDIVVELKTMLSFKLLDQAIDRLHLAHYVYIAIPERKSAIPRTVEWVLKQKGIGLLMVSEIPNGLINKHLVQVMIPAKFNRVLRKGLIRKHIKDYHEEEVGGVPSGEGKTEYSILMENIKLFLRRKGWVTIDEILEQFETHYAQPKPSLVATLQEDWNKDWCEIKVENGERYFRYKK